VKILKYPHPSLAKKAVRIESIDEEVRQTARGMLDAMAIAHGVGLAGPQVGYLRRLIVLNPSPGNPDTEAVYVNPEIVSSEGEATASEGCLSLPGINGKVTRSARVRVNALGLDGQPLVVDAEGLQARAFQHEIDHLDGVLITSRFSALDKAANARALRDLEKAAKATASHR
jgi:peptide deformylase